MKFNQKSILISRLFILGLALLLINDFYLKPTFGNVITGKLSDFSGLFIFPLFWVSFFPNRKNFIFVSTAVLFIIWKSTYSQPFIDFWNSLSPFQIHRVVDDSDLMALFVLPLSYLYSKQNFTTLKLNPVFTLMVSVFAFMATSYLTTIPQHKIYYFDYGIINLKQKIIDLPNIKIQNYKNLYQIDSTGLYRINKYNIDTIPVKEFNLESQLPNKISFFVNENFCRHGYTVSVNLFGDDIKSILLLNEFSYDCPKDEGGNDDSDFLIKSFEKNVINSLKIN